MDTPNEDVEVTPSVPAESGRLRTRRPSEQRVSDILKSQRRLVAERVEEILDIDPDMISLRNEQKTIARRLHVTRLNLTKKTQKVERLSGDVSILLEQLKEFHKTERELADKFAKNSENQQLKEQKVALTVARGMGFGDTAV